MSEGRSTSDGRCDIAKIIIMTSNRRFCGYKWQFEIDLPSVGCFNLYPIAMIILEWNVRVNKLNELDLAVFAVMFEFLDHF